SADEHAACAVVRGRGAEVLAAPAELLEPTLRLCERERREGARHDQRTGEAIRHEQRSPEDAIRRQRAIRARERRTGRRRRGAEPVERSARVYRRASARRRDANSASSRALARRAASAGDRERHWQISNCVASVKPVVNGSSGSRYQNWQYT